MKYLFVISIVLSIAMLVNLINIFFDHDHFSRFGYGYLTGKVILLIIFAVAALLTGKKTFNSPN
jgi:hypothetical protein